MVFNIFIIKNVVFTDNLFMRESLFIKEEIQKLNKTISLLEEKVLMLEKENLILKNRTFNNRENLFVRFFNKIFNRKSKVNYNNQEKTNVIHENLRKFG